MSEAKKLSLTEAADLYETLDYEMRAALMVYVSYELTISSRGIHYDLLQSPETQVATRLQERLAGINELQHQIADRLLSYFDKRDGGRLDNEFFTALLQMAEAHDIPVSVQNALVKGMSRCGR